MWAVSTPLGFVYLQLSPVLFTIHVLRGCAHVPSAYHARLFGEHHHPQRQLPYLGHDKDKLLYCICDLHEFHRPVLRPQFHLPMHW